MKKKHLLRSIMAIVLCAVMLSGIFAVGYSIYLNEQGKKVVIDKDNNLPVIKPVNGSASANVTTENGKTTNDVTLNSTDGSIVAVIPSGTLLNEGASKVTLTVKEMENSQANVELEANEEKSSFDIHIEGVSSANTSPIKVYIKEMLPVGLNMGNYKLYHVENGVTNEMTLLDGEAVHNSFEYDPVTGDVTLYLASFSEVAVISTEEGVWKGNVDYSWYDKDATELVIANADQLAAFGKIVGGMDGQARDSFEGKTVKLVSDINLNDNEKDNNDWIFHPIGYYYNENYTFEDNTTGVYSAVHSFKGTFNGNGHKISNFYQNTWEIKGDYDANYYSDAMGLFGYVNGATIKNLTVDSFSSDGEFTPTGVIAAYAVNSAFTNIAITNCNPRVYNTGNGGIVGIGGNSNDPDTYELIFTNITIDNSNKISALWGSWDVACGGLIGMFRGAGHAHMTNCHVAAQIDVFNDVCGNYQYYWYRYAGMMIGTNKNMVTDKDGYTVPETSKFHAEGCTVHFGEWNDYYYCELVANSLASYTHDHQFSRLEIIDSLDEIKSGDTWLKTGNFLLISGDTKTCYHIVKNDEGKLVQHLHTDAGYEDEKGIDENGDGEIDLREDKQIVYLPFNQLFTGYGWGVKHIPVYNGENYAFEGITILDRKVANSVVKFDKLFTGDFLYRVGNQNTVSLGSLFAAAEGATINNSGVWVTIEALDDNSSASGTFTANTTDWTKATIQFSGTGVVKVTIQDYVYCTPTVLYLEVVDATNATGATNATDSNVVLLKDCTFGSLEVSGGYTLFGNGFTMTCSSDSYAADLGYSFVTLNNGTLDNVQIVCPNFDYAALYKSNLTSADNRSYTDATGKVRYYNARSGVMVSGNSQILNSRISGARAAVNVSSGNLLIDNSRVEYGAVANILVGAANSLVLKDVTLLQEPVESTYKADGVNGTKIMGFSVLFICNSEGNAAPCKIKGTLVQNAWVDESDSAYVPVAGKSIISNVLSNTNFTHDLDGDGTKESLNLGFAYMPETASSSVNATTITDNRTNKNSIPYDYAKVSISNGSTYVYSYKYNENEDIPKEFTKTEDYTPNKYSDIITVTYSDTSDGITDGKSFGTDGWVFEVNVDLDKLNGYALDFSKLSMNVNGVAISNYLVNDGAKPTSPVAVVAGGTSYKLTAVISDKEYTAYFKVIGTEASKDSPSIVATNYESAILVGEAGSIASKDTWHGAVPALKGIQIRYWSVAEKQYKTITLSDYTPTTAGKQNGTNTTWTYTPDNGDFTLTLTGGQVHSSNNVSAMPVVVNNTLYFVSAASNGLVNYGNDARTIPVSYSFKDNNGGEELKFSNTWSIACADKATAYDYSDFCNGTSKTFTIKSSNGNSCVTPDTLVTLADGTQKEIQYATSDDMFLVWDFVKGEYTAMPASIIMNHGYDKYTVVTLTFDDGTVVNTINGHGFFEDDSNKFVVLSDNNADEYIGHSFVKADGTTTKLVSYTVTEEYTESWSILTAVNYNCILNGMLTITPAEVEGSPDYLMPFEVNDDMKYDETKMQEDIEKYGLYTYDDFSEYMTYEQYTALNLSIFKVSIGKGYITWDDILYLISIHIG